jgi:hypothetical protein
MGKAPASGATARASRPAKVSAQRPAVTYGVMSNPKNDPAGRRPTTRLVAQVWFGESVERAVLAMLEDPGER